MSEVIPDETTRVLLVEDNPIDVRLIRYALRGEKSWRTETVVADDGEKAIDFLMEEESRAKHAKTDLVILDLNLPKRDGTEVLRTIRESQILRTMPVIILSSSPEDVILDKVRDAKVEADCYFTKPLGADEFLNLGHKLRACYDRIRRREGL